MAQEELYTLADVSFKRETAAAILVETLAGDEVWIPLSQVRSIARRKNGTGDITMTVWIAKAKGLI